MRQYDLYSDASFDEKQRLGTYSFICVDQRGRIYSQDIGSGRYSNVFQVEIAGIIAAIESLPPECAAMSHSDIRTFNAIYGRGQDSRHPCIRKLCKLVSVSGIEFSNEFERRKELRSDWYSLMHERSNLHLRALLGKKPRNN